MQALKSYDLVRGSGEWTNMQPVVRQAFQRLFEQSDKQQQQIQDLLEIAVNLKGQLAQRPTQADMQRMVEDKVRQLLPRSVSKDKHESLALAVSALRTEVERKASVHYVDESLRRKADKSDALLARGQFAAIVASGAGAGAGEGDLQASLRGLVREETRGLAAELGATKSMQDSLHRGLTDLARDAGASRELRSHVSSLSATVAELGRAVAVIDVGSLERALAHKADRRDLDGLLAGKADKSVVAAGLDAVERALADQERIVTALRLRPVGAGNGSGFGSGGAAANGFGATYAADEEADLLNATLFGGGGGGGGGVDVDDVAEGGEMGMGRRLRAGREEVVLSALWSRVQVLSRDVVRWRGESRATLLRVDGLETAVNSCAGVAQAEALSVIAEEQKDRLDALESGRIRVQPVSDELAALDARIRSVERFLSAPGGKRGRRIKDRAIGKDKDKQEGEFGWGVGALSDLLDEQAASTEATTQTVAELSTGLSEAAHHAARAEEAVARVAQALAASERVRRESEGDAAEELRRIRTRLAAVDRVLLRKDREEYANLGESAAAATSAALNGGAAAGLVEGADSGSRQPPPPPAATGSLGAASVDARIALLQSEKARLRAQL